MAMPCQPHAPSLVAGQVARLGQELVRFAELARARLQASALNETLSDEDGQGHAQQTSELRSQRLPPPRPSAHGGRSPASRRAAPCCVEDSRDAASGAGTPEPPWTPEPPEREEASGGSLWLRSDAGGSTRDRPGSGSQGPPEPPWAPHEGSEDQSSSRSCSPAAPVALGQLKPLCLDQAMLHSRPSSPLPAGTRHKRRRREYPPKRGLLPSTLPPPKQGHFDSPAAVVELAELRWEVAALRRLLAPRNSTDSPPPTPPWGQNGHSGSSSPVREAAPQPASAEVHTSRNQETRAGRLSFLSTTSASQGGSAASRRQNHATPHREEQRAEPGSAQDRSRSASSPGPGDAEYWAKLPVPIGMPQQPYRPYYPAAFPRTSEKELSGSRVRESRRQVQASGARARARHQEEEAPARRQSVSSSEGPEGLILSPAQDVAKTLLEGHSRTMLESPAGPGDFGNRWLFGKGAEHEQAEIPAEAYSEEAWVRWCVEERADLAALEKTFSFLEASPEPLSPAALASSLEAQEGVPEWRRVALKNWLERFEAEGHSKDEWLKWCSHEREQLTGLEDTFSSLDVSGHGYLLPDEVRVALSDGSSLPEAARCKLLEWTRWLASKSEAEQRGQPGTPERMASVTCETSASALNAESGEVDVAYWVQIDTIFGLPAAKDGSGCKVRTFWSDIPDDIVEKEEVLHGRPESAERRSEMCVVRDQLMLPLRPVSRQAGSGLSATVTVVSCGSSEVVGSTRLEVLDPENHRVQEHPLQGGLLRWRPGRIRLRIRPAELMPASPQASTMDGAQEQAPSGGNDPASLPQREDAEEHKEEEDDVYGEEEEEEEEDEDTEAGEESEDTATNEKDAGEKMVSKDEGTAMSKGEAEEDKNTDGEEGDEQEEEGWHEEGGEEEDAEDDEVVEVDEQDAGSSENTPGTQAKDPS
eukprot:TRINITY_DN3657_c0_g1_i1.p1 TRINITY_DN3657_c0_g1~~TRINITY_DN3657_c0_g1_i1.p1  ORF type:complete len:928 (+),score=225.87 TRINITY_DN3657_c0_g1_i1:51-2834(+)